MNEYELKDALVNLAIELSQIKSLLKMKDERIAELEKDLKTSQFHLMTLREETDMFEERERRRDEKLEDHQKVVDETKEIKTSFPASYIGEGEL